MNGYFIRRERVLNKSRWHAVGHSNPNDVYALCNHDWMPWREVIWSGDAPSSEDRHKLCPVCSAILGKRKQTARTLDQT